MKNYIILALASVVFMSVASAPLVGYHETNDDTRNIMMAAMGLNDQKDHRLAAAIEKTLTAKSLQGDNSDSYSDTYSDSFYSDSSYSDSSYSDSDSYSGSYGGYGY